MSIGISSWSAALLAMVDALHPSQRFAGARIVQILGGVGNPSAEAHATHLTRRLANLLSGRATLLPAPGVVGSAEARRVLMKDAFVQEATALLKSVTVALVGIGAVEPSKLLASSGNVFSPQELEALSAKGAVGDICLRFFDADGKPVSTPLNDRVISIDLDSLRRVDRVVGVAGGSAKDRRHPGRAAGRLGQRPHHRFRHRGAPAGPAGRRRPAASHRDHRPSAKSRSGEGMMLLRPRPVLYLLAGSSLLLAMAMACPPWTIVPIDRAGIGGRGTAKT